VRITVPRLDQRTLKTPVLKTGRREAREPVSEAPGITPSPLGWELGDGPFYYQGERASKPEWRVLLTLMRLGWQPAFQVRKFGGRSLAGGQVLDILVTQRRPIVYIDVRGYYHKGAEGEAKDARKILQLRASNPDVKVLIVWEDETENREMLYSRLLHEVGAYGR